MTANTLVQGQRVKGQGHSVRNSQHRFTSIMSRFVTYLPRQCVEHMPQRACALRIVGGSAPRGGCQAHFAKHRKQYCQTKQTGKTHNVWREVGVAFEMQCRRNCTLSSYYYYAAFNAPWACVSQEEESQARGSRDDLWVAVTVEKKVLSLLLKVLAVTLRLPVMSLGRVFRCVAHYI